MTLEEVMDEIEDLIARYEFPLEVLQDINKRLSDCYEIGYAKQQLRYLKNTVNHGMAKEKKKVTE